MYIKKVILAFIAVFIATISFEQDRIEDILKFSGNYNDIVAKAERHFKAERQKAGLNGAGAEPELDDDYVKFKRWQSFWKNSLTPDGKLGDITAYWREKRSSPSLLGKMSSPYSGVSWANLSHDNYIKNQIGLGRTTCVAFHPTNQNIFYVGTAIGGIWKTTDGGLTYKAMGDDLPFMAVSSIIVNKNNPSRIFAALSDVFWFGPPSIGVYSSIDGGLNWQPTPLSFRFSDDKRIYHMEADPNDANNIFIATENGLYRTTDGYLSVKKINSISTFDVKFNAGNSQTVYQCGNNGEFYQSTNGGTTFKLIKDFGDDNVIVATTSLDASKVYARNGKTLYMSYDSGASFSSNTVTMPENGSVLCFSPTNQNVLLTGNFETQRSDNDGASFYATSQWFGEGGLSLIHVDQRNIFTNPLQPDFVYYCNDGGLYRYILSTNTFQFIGNGLKITQYFDISVAQTDPIVLGGGSQDNGSMYREADGKWGDYAPTGDGMNGDIDPTDANTRYWAYQYGSLQRWESGVNTGISPPGQEDQGVWETPWQLDPTNPSRIIAGYARIYESFDKGDNWSDITGNANFGGKLNELAVAKANPNRIYAVRDNQLFVKAVNGNTWTTRTLPGTASDIEVDPVDMNTLYISVSGFTNGSKVFKSTDAGFSWINYSGSLPNVSAQALEGYESIEGGLFVGTDAGVFYRDNSLSDWQQYGNLPNTRVTDIEIQYAAKLIRVGTHGRGIFEAPLIINKCSYGAPDADNDGVCDANDACPNFDNKLNGTPCNDGDPNTIGEKYDGCECKGGIPNQTFCTAAGLDQTGDDWIKRVVLSNLDNSSGKSLHSNFRSKFATLGAGSTYKLIVELNGVYPLDKVYAWIDFNRNSAFSATELITLSSPNNDTRFEGTVNVPADVGKQSTTMRVRSLYSNSNTAQACGDYYGEVEDYSIIFDYCQVGGSIGSGSDWISHVKLNSISNASGQTYYSDFTQISTSLARGQSYPIEIKMNISFGPDDVYAWIDYNHNKIFEESERITMSKPPAGNGSVSTGVVSVPASALAGETVMRVRSQFDDPNVPSPCGTVYGGEAEDYTINITYCAAEGAVGTGGDYINRVAFNTINNVSLKSAYSNFKNISTSLIRGASYPIEVQVNYAFGPDSVYVWIDYNKNGLFENAEQTIMSKLTANAANSVANGMVKIPVSAIQGETVMRVRVIYASPNTAKSCDAYFGEVEDYTVNLSYCGGSGAEGTGGDWINNVRVNNLENPSIQTSYSNYKAVSTPVYKNNSYQLAININYAFALDTAYAWIDYNRDNSFTTDERVMMSNLVANSASSSTGTITVPAGVEPGEVTLRVRVIYANPNPPDPCNSYFGEVEDYTLKILDNQGLGPCLPAITLGKELNSLASGTYKAAESVTSTSIISNPRVIKVTAGKSILLNPGFIAEKGTVVTLQIAPCNQ